MLFKRLRLVFCEVAQNDVLLFLKAFVQFGDFFISLVQILLGRQKTKFLTDFHITYQRDVKLQEKCAL